MGLLRFSSETNCIAAALYHFIEGKEIGVLILARHKDMLQLGCVLYFGKHGNLNLAFWVPKLASQISIHSRPKHHHMQVL